MHKKEIARLIHDLKTGKATDLDKKMLEEFWESALNDGTVLDEMSPDSHKKLKNEMFHYIRTRLGHK